MPVHFSPLGLLLFTLFPLKQQQKKRKITRSVTRFPHILFEGSEEPVVYGGGSEKDVLV